MGENQEQIVNNVEETPITTGAWSEGDLNAVLHYTKIKGTAIVSGFVTGGLAIASLVGFLTGDPSFGGLSAAASAMGATFTGYNILDMKQFKETYSKLSGKNPFETEGRTR